MHSNHKNKVGYGNSIHIAILTCLLVFTLMVPYCGICSTYDKLHFSNATIDSNESQKLIINYKAFTVVLPISNSGIGPHLLYFRIYLLNYTQKVGSFGSYGVYVKCVYPPPHSAVNIRVLKNSKKVILISACWARLPVILAGNAYVRVVNSSNIIHTNIRMHLRLAVLNVSNGKPVIRINNSNYSVIVKPRSILKILNNISLKYYAVADARVLPPKSYINGTYVGNIIPFYIPWPRNGNDIEELIMKGWKLTYMGTPIRIGVDHQGLIEIYAPLDYEKLEVTVAEKSLFYFFNYISILVNGTALENLGSLCNNSCIEKILTKLSRGSHEFQYVKNTFVAGGAVIPGYISESLITENLGFPTFIDGAPLPVTSTDLGFNISRLVLFTSDFNYTSSLMNLILNSKVKIPHEHTVVIGNVLAVAIILASLLVAAVAIKLLKNSRKR